MNKNIIAILIISFLLTGCQKEVKNYNSTDTTSENIAGVNNEVIVKTGEKIIKDSIDKKSNTAAMPLDLMFQYPEKDFNDRELDWLGMNWSIKTYYNKYEKEVSMIDISLYFPAGENEFATTKMRELTSKFLDKYTYVYHVENFEETNLYVDMPPIKIVSKFKEDKTGHDIFSIFEIGVNKTEKSGNLPYIKISFVDEEKIHDIDMLEVKDAINYLETVSKINDEETNFKKMYFNAKSGFMQIEDKEEKYLTPEERLNSTTIFTNP